MEENKNILNNEQLNSIVETLEENKSDTDKLLEQIEKDHENDDNSNDPLIEGEGQYISDGVIIGVENDIDFDHFENIDTDLDLLVEDNIKNTLTNKFELSDEDALKFVNVISRVKNNENFNVYNELPDTLKKYIDDSISNEGILPKDKSLYTNSMAKMFIKELISDAEFDSISIDLEKAMKELIPAPIEMYSETNRDYIENKFLEVAENIKDKEPKKAENLLNMRKGFIDSYTLEPMYELFKDFKIMNKVRKSDNLWKRVNIEYEKVAGVCKFTLYPLESIRSALINIGLSKESASRLVSLFVYTYTNGIEDFKNQDEYNDIYRNALANYFEMNIRNLSISPGLASEFSKTIKENIFNLSNHIDSVIVEREKELSSNKKKRR